MKIFHKTDNYEMLRNKVKKASIIDLVKHFEPEQLDLILIHISDNEDFINWLDYELTEKNIDWKNKTFTFKISEVRYRSNTPNLYLDINIANRRITPTAYQLD